MQVLNNDRSLYALGDGQKQIQFVKYTDGKLIHEGTTNEELLEIVIDRTQFLDSKFPCIENKVAIEALKIALDALNNRTHKRVAQGMETKDIAHVS